MALDLHRLATQDPQEPREMKLPALPEEAPGRQPLGPTPTPSAHERESRDATESFDRLGEASTPPPNKMTELSSELLALSALLRLRIDGCLLGKAGGWYTEELSHLERVRLRLDTNGVEEWCKALEERFRDPPGRSLAVLETTRYTVEDACRQRDPADYVHCIIANGRSSGLATTGYAQVLWAYEHLDAELRRDLPQPNEETTISDLMQHLNYVKHLWFDLFRERPRLDPGSHAAMPPHRTQGQPRASPPGRFLSFCPPLSRQRSRPWQHATYGNVTPATTLHPSPYRCY